MNTRVFVSLDVDSADAAFRLVEPLGGEASAYKVGLQLLTAEGPDVVQRLVAMGKQVFLDLKLHEIPNSVAGAVAAAGQLGATMVTVHASAGSAVLRAAVEAARAYPSLQVLALTVITSLRDEDLPEIGLAPSVVVQVERLARLAVASGCQGVVASVQEAAVLASVLPPRTLIVAPGIQLGSTQANDQSRIATPALAARAGATHIVVGRAVTRAADPLQAFREVAQGFDAPRNNRKVRKGWLTA
ncbi:orotidine-5'-phosphate decarboxylase [Pseudorhodoferax sp. Leaf267]|uniref:orotidine-5'-phosphate decarboxylase n=1 Tax=Pseudorhodoferax sp. Leaf267 TaxID=1736316 RepID=UPI0009E6AD1F|nr:orotidine-5'-phosphate decarboxylase [Pseudorhodoferax sp. Leaf267]